jgi:predicted N-acyltransferase
VTATREPSVIVVERISSIPREQWNSLLEADDSPFIEWEWLSALEESGCVNRRAGWMPAHIAVYLPPDGQLVAACPLYLKSHSMGEFVFDYGWAEAAARRGLRYYPKLLAAVPFTPHSGRRFLTRPGSDRALLCKLLAASLTMLCTENKLSSVHVNFCLPDEAAALEGAGFIQRLGYQYHWHNRGFVEFDDYLSQLRHKRRYAIKYERAQLAAQDITIRVYQGSEIPDSLFDPMFNLYRSTVEKFYWGQQYLKRKFFELLRTSFKSKLCFVCAYRGQNLLAATFNVQKAGVFYGRYWGCFEDIKYLHFNVSYYAAIEHCIRAGLKRFEPGAGGDYKWLRGFDPAPTLSAHLIADPQMRRAIRDAIAREWRQVEDWIAFGRANTQFKPPPPSNSSEATRAGEIISDDT